MHHSSIWKQRVWSFLSVLKRVAIFLVCLAVVLAAVIIGERIMLTMLISQGFSGEQGLSIPAMIIMVLSGSALFQKIIRQKSARTPLIILTIYIILLAIDGVLLTSGLEPLPGAIWICLILGVIGYFVIRPFKKPMMAEEKDG